MSRDEVDVLVERDRFLRYHIGESLLASCQSTLKLSGACDAVAAHGFQVERGALFHHARQHPARHPACAPTAQGSI